jgi:hypothetical protein
LNFLLSSGDPGCFHSILRGFAFSNVMEDPTSCPSETMHLKNHHFCFDNSMTDFGRLSNCCTHALLRVVLETILHRFSATQVRLG